MGIQKGQRSLKDLLKEKDPELYSRLDLVWQNARKEIHNRQQSKNGHKTGTEHCRQVEDNLTKLIPDAIKENYKPIGLFILSASACLHDIGKAVASERDHGIISMQEIIENYNKYNLDEGQAIIIGKIVGAHNDDEQFNNLDINYPIGAETIRIKEFAALLRLADVLDTFYFRVPIINLGIPEKMLLHGKTRFRKLVQGWDYSTNDRNIVQIKVRPEIDNDINIVMMGCSMMNEQIKQVTPYLKLGNFPTQLTLDIDYIKMKMKIEIEKQKVKGFAGMDSLTENYVFRGRIDEINNLFGKITLSPITLLLGDSGVGKTSLIEAGLFPLLKKLPDWKCILVRPYDKPVFYLTNSLQNNFIQSGYYDKSDLIQTIRDISDKYTKFNILIVVDQFEDIFNASSDELEEFGRVFPLIQTRVYRNIHFLITYRSDCESKIVFFLEKYVGNISYPKIVLKPLDCEKAKEALVDGFKAENIGIQDEGNRKLLAGILKDIEFESRFMGKDVIYPPFIQILGFELCQNVEKDAPIITWELYENKLGKASNIIGNYLFNQLNKFGRMRDSAENILKKLVFEGKKHYPKNKGELESELKIEHEEFEEVLKRLDKFRMIRQLGNSFEIIHDFLAKKIENELIQPKEKRLRNAIFSLKLKASSYEVTNELLNPFEMVSLYNQKELVMDQLENDIKKKKLLFHSLIAENGPGWWWYKKQKYLQLLPYIIEGFKRYPSNLSRKTLFILPDFYNSQTKSIIMGMLLDKNPKVRKDVYELITERGSKEDIFKLKEMLKEGGSDLEQLAIDAIARFGSKKEQSNLKESIRDLDKNLRVDALKSLSYMFLEDDIPFLKEMLKEKSYRVRKSAIKALYKTRLNQLYFNLKPLLKKLEMKELVQLLLSIIQLGTEKNLFSSSGILNDIRSFLKKNCIKSPLYSMKANMLGTINTLTVEEAIALIDSIIKNTSKQGFLRILNTLDKVNKNLIEDMVIKISKASKFSDIQMFREVLKDFDEDVRAAALKAIFILGSNEDIPIIKEMLIDVDEDIREEAIEAIAKLGSKEDIPNIKKMLNDGIEDVRVAAIEAIAKLGSKEDIPSIKKMLNDGIEDVRVAAIEAIAKLGSKEDIPQLKEMLLDDTDYVKIAAIEAIAKLGSNEDISSLNELLNDKSENVRFSTLEALLQLGLKLDISTIKNLIMTEDIHTKKQIAKILANSINSIDESDIKKLIKSSIKEERLFGIYLLSQTGKQISITLLEESFEDKEPFIKLTALLSIMKLKPEKYFQILIEMLKNDDFSIRMAIILFIAKNVSKNFGVNISELLDNEREIVIDTIFDFFIQYGIIELSEKYKLLYEIIVLHSNEILSEFNTEFLSKTNYIFKERIETRYIIGYSSSSNYYKTIEDKYLTVLEDRYYMSSTYNQDNFNMVFILKIIQALILLKRTDELEKILLKLIDYVQTNPENLNSLISIIILIDKVLYYDLK